MSANNFTVAEIAHVIHAANRALQIIHRDPAVSPEWSEASRSQRMSCIEGVVDALAGSTPEESHNDWCAHLRSHGWRYGPVKDEQAKTHPCLVPFEQLDFYQRAKSELFVAIVRALRPDGSERARDGHG